MTRFVMQAAMTRLNALPVLICWPTANIGFVRLAHFGLELGEIQISHLKRQIQANQDKMNVIRHDENSGIASSLELLSGLLRADGSVLWDEETPVQTRLVTEAEHNRWQRA